MIPLSHIILPFAPLSTTPRSNHILEKVSSYSRMTRLTLTGWRDLLAKMWQQPLACACAYTEFFVKYLSSIKVLLSLWLSMFSYVIEISFHFSLLSRLLLPTFPPTFAKSHWTFFNFPTYFCRHSKGFTPKVPHENPKTPPLFLISQGICMDFYIAPSHFPTSLSPQKVAHLLSPKMYDKSLSENFM